MLAPIARSTPGGGGQQTNNTLYYGDNLEVLREHPAGPMKAEAAVGVHENEFGRFQWLATLTPVDLLHGAGAKLPPLAPTNRRHARVEMRTSHKAGGQGSLL